MEKIWKKLGINSRINFQIFCLESSKLKQKNLELRMVQK